MDVRRTAQVNQVVGAVGVPPPPQIQTQDPAGVAAWSDPEFMMLRTNTREKIFKYIERKTGSDDWRRRLPELARRLEEILFMKYPSKREYYCMMRAPIEPQLQYAIKTLSARNQQNQQNLASSRQIASSPGHGTMILTPGIVQGANENSRMSYVTGNIGPSSSSADMVPPNTNMGTLLPGEAPDEHVNTLLSLGMNPTQHDHPRANNNNLMIDTVDTPATNRLLIRVYAQEVILGIEAIYARRLLDLASRLEEILFRRYTNKNLQRQQNRQLSRQITCSPPYATMAVTPGITQGASENSGMSRVIGNIGPLSSGPDMVPLNANMGEAPDEHVNTLLSLGMNPTHHDRPRACNNNLVIDTADTPATNRLLREYYNMTKGPIEPTLQFAMKLSSVQNRRQEQNRQLSRQITCSPRYGTMIVTPGITQGASEISRMSYVTGNIGPLSSGANMVRQNASMGTLLPEEAPDEHVNTVLSLGMNPTHHDRPRACSNNLVIDTVETSETNRRLAPRAPVKEVAKKPKFSCPVCWNELTNASSTICGHIFCQKCIKAAIQAQNKCPTCRKTLTMKGFHPVHLPTMD
ncbi:putative histone acetyltransferase HAC-like 1 [Hordeum vulgare]|nr:putative histone acetyltransferase HAC-like 1 [Hordeum vulgare]